MIRKGSWGEEMTVISLRELKEYLEDQRVNPDEKTYSVNDILKLLDDFRHYSVHYMDLEIED